MLSVISSSSASNIPIQIVSAAPRDWVDFALAGGSIASGLLLGVAALLALGQLSAMRKAAKFQALTNLLRDFNSDAFRAKVRLLQRDHGVSRAPRPITESINDQRDAIEDAVLDIGLFYDMLGRMVRQRLVDETLVLDALGRSVVEAWEILRPYIKGDQTITGPPADFAWLVKRARRRGFRPTS